MDTNQIYQLVNAVNQEAFGAQALSVKDTAGLVSLGNTILSSNTNTEAFLNTLVQRIGRTIISYRRYRSKLADMVRDDFEWGAILQKIRVHMPEAEADESYGLVDGQSVDHYKIAKPEVQQKFFVTRSPYQFHVTIQKVHLKEAFLSESSMGAFLGAVTGQVRNAMEVTLENLGRITLANMAAEVSNPSNPGLGRVYSLVSMYNQFAQPSEALTPDTAMFVPAFLAYAMQIINETIDGFQELGSYYNIDSIETFTPKEMIRVKVVSPFVRAAETVLQYRAFNEELVSIDSAYQKLAFWQNPDAPMSISIKRASDGTEISMPNVIAMVHDRDALGMYREEEEVATTPINAAGLYYNTYYHAKQLWFNDLSENFVVFTLD